MLSMLIVITLCYTAYMSKFVAARFCEGGHICSLPRECCTQGCCPPYQSGPRQLPPPSDHVLNLFFISHWFFWCVVVAIILAILCAYSLWKKRRTLCGWGFNEHNAQSEGDSAGSCYAPPQYSRCNSFLHPPPPYTEVTSKPDLYPLVYTCNGDNGKNGSSYLMVQYFRNYIVRPAGSLSAASTVDSLSSSFICNINEANTLVPPPYSRAASPDVGFNSHFQQQYMMPRSASQVVCQNITNALAANGAGGQYEMNGNILGQQLYYGRGAGNHYATVTINSAMGRVGGVGGSVITDRIGNYNANPLDSESGTLYDEMDDSVERTSDHVNANVINSGEMRTLPNSTGFVQSQSDQHFRYITNSNSSISDIFVNNSCAAGIGGGGGGGGGGGVATDNVSGTQRSEDTSVSGSVSGAAGGIGVVVHPQVGGTPVIYSNGSIKPNPLHRASTNPTQFTVESPRDPLYQSNNSIGGISITVPATCSADNSTILRNGNELRDLQMLRRSLETCCQLLQQQQKLPSGSFGVGDSPLRMNDLTKKYIDEGLLRSYFTSGTCSGVSSLANIGTPTSPPQATSPTGEVKEIIDQIRQLQEGVYKYEEDLFLRSTRPVLQQTLSSPSPTIIENNSKLQRIATMPEPQTSLIDNVGPNSASAVSPNASAANTPSSSSAAVGTNGNKLTSSKSLISSTGVSGIFTSSKRPSSLQQSKKRFYCSKPPSKAMYIPMMATNTVTSGNRCILKSPVSNVVASSFFVNRGNRSRKGWISRSAPTTPATPLPPNYLGDDSPLLHEHDEDQEGEQSAEMD